MNLIITTRKIELSDGARAKIEKKIQKLDKYFGEDTNANVTITRERDRETVELTVYKGSMIFRAQSTTKDTIESLNDAIDILEGQIRKNKTRLSKKLRTGFEAVYDNQPAAPLGGDEDEEFNVVKLKRFPLKPMTTEEAILQMNMLNHTFFAFKNTSGIFSIVYKRKDGDYAVIESA